MPFEPLPPDERLYEQRRVYAYTEGVEPDDAEPGERCTVFLDALDADWFDDRPERRGPFQLPELESESPLSILTTEEDFGQGPFTAGENRTGWWEIDLRSPKLKALHYATLFSAPIERSMGWPKQPSQRTIARLAQAASLDDIDDADPEEIAVHLPEVGPVDYVAVYDIGHGNCNAACQGGQPSLYFDFGGGVLANARTYPKHIDFCFSREPPVVLSHWDWDHWASGDRHPRSQELQWIVPRQRMGAQHRRFAAQLAARGTLLIWPDSLPSLRSSTVEIIKCTGSDRNDSGLAAYVGGTLLLPGDASYPSIPDAFDRPLEGLVASHHGGRRRNGRVPPPAANTAHKIVYSFGDGNRYGHPNAASVTQHQGAGWIHSASTAKDRGPYRGHVRLDGPPPQVAGCNNTNCTLNITK